MRLLVVDDEPTSRSTILQLCDEDADVRVVGEAGSGAAAIRCAENVYPDVLLLEVCLPDMSGFEVLRAVRNEEGPVAIFVATQTDHAAAAFEAGAVDYLVKPVSPGRFARSLGRARARLQWHSSPPGANDPTARAGLLIGEKDRRFYPLRPADIEYIESEGNYVTFRSANADYLSRDSLKRLTSVLAAAGFVRIERSLMLNLRAIAFAEPAGHGTFAFTLESGTVLQSSATYRDDILRILPLVRAGHKTA